LVRSPVEPEGVAKVLARVVRAHRVLGECAVPPIGDYVIDRCPEREPLAALRISCGARSKSRTLLLDQLPCDRPPGSEDAKQCLKLIGRRRAGSTIGDSAFNPQAEAVLAFASLDEARKDYVAHGEELIFIGSLDQLRGGERNHVPMMAVTHVDGHVHKRHLPLPVWP
jgi:hypothetical protein